MECTARLHARAVVRTAHVFLSPFPLKVTFAAFPPFVTSVDLPPPPLCSLPTCARYVYFARPDSVMDGVPIYESRLRMGEALARKIMRENPNHGIDVVSVLYTPFLELVVTWSVVCVDEIKMVNG